MKFSNFLLIASMTMIQSVYSQYLFFFNLDRSSTLFTASRENYSSFFLWASVAAWWIFSVLASFLSKQGLNVFPSATILTLSQMACGSLTLLFFKRQDLFDEISKYGAQGRKKLAFISLAQFMGNLFTNWSMILVPVSFTHTVKGAEPLFTYFFGFLLVKQEIRLWTVLSILMVVSGVALSSTYEVQFSSTGLLLALGSNVCFATRNVLVGTLAKDSKKTVLFGLSSLLGTVFAFGNLFLGSMMQTKIDVPNLQDTPFELAVIFLAAGLAHFSYNLYSFMVLGQVRPLTHSLINVFKRMLIIFGSVLFFKHSLYFGNVVGIIVTLCGISLYSYMSKRASYIKVVDTISKDGEAAHKTDEISSPFLKSDRASGLSAPSIKLSMLALLSGIFGCFVLSSRSKLIKSIPENKIVLNFGDLFRDTDLLSLITNQALEESGMNSTTNQLQVDFKMEKDRVIFPRLYIRQCLNFKIPDPDVLKGVNIAVDSVKGLDLGYDYLLDRFVEDSSVKKYDSKNGISWLCGGEDSDDISRCKNSQFTICPPQMITCVFQSIICKSIPVVDDFTIKNIKSLFPATRFFIYSYGDYMDGAIFSPGIIDKNTDVFLDQHTISWIEQYGRRVEFPDSTINVCEQVRLRDIKSDTGNTGDLFGLKVVSHIIKMSYPTDSIKVVAKSMPQECHRFKALPFIYSVGSLIQWAYQVDIPVIWGSGKISSKSMKLNKKAYWLGVRGPRTREDLLVNYDINPTVVGDPALFAREMYSFKSLNEHDVGFIIHPVDVKAFKEKFPQFKNYLINPEDKFEKYLNDLAKYRLVVSSSLHGVIFCHAFDIPVLPLRMGGLVVGEEYKFKDHYHSLGHTEFRKRLNFSEILGLKLDQIGSKIEKYWQPIKRPISLEKLKETFPLIEIRSSNNKP